MRKKKDIVYEKDLGLDFEFDDALEEEDETAQDGALAEESAAEPEGSPEPPPFPPQDEMDSPPDWSRVREDDSFVGVDRHVDHAPVENNIGMVPDLRLEDLENKVAQLENKMDRIVSLLEHISSIYGKKTSS